MYCTILTEHLDLLQFQEGICHVLYYTNRTLGPLAVPGRYMPCTVLSRIFPRGYNRIWIEFRVTICFSSNTPCRICWVQKQFSGMSWTSQHKYFSVFLLWNNERKSDTMKGKVIQWKEKWYNEGESDTMKLKEIQWRGKWYNEGKRDTMKGKGIHKCVAG